MRKDAFDSVGCVHFGWRRKHGKGSSLGTYEVGSDAHKLCDGGGGTVCLVDWCEKREPYHRGFDNACQDAHE